LLLSQSWILGCHPLLILWHVQPGAVVREEAHFIHIISVEPGTSMNRGEGALL